MLQLLDKSVLQLHVTALFYLDNSRKIHPRGVRACRPKDAKRRAPQCAGERESELWLLFLLVFLSLGLSYVNWASQECCLFYLRSSLRSSDLPLFYFRGLFPSLSFSHRHFGLLFPILTTSQVYPRHPEASCCNAGTSVPPSSTFYQRLR